MEFWLVDRWLPGVLGGFTIAALTLIVHHVFQRRFMRRILTEIIHPLRQLAGLPNPPEAPMASTTSHEGALRGRLERFAGVRHPANVADDLASDGDARAERIARRAIDFMGTARFLIYQTAAIIAWVTYNLLAVSFDYSGWAFDKYPFILLNLAFSTQAAYAAPMILLSGRKSEARARVQADLDFQHNATSLKILRALAGAMKVDITDDDSKLT